MPKERIDYYYRGRSSSKSELRSFASSQSKPAKYLVQAWTNSIIGKVPQVAVLEHIYYKDERTAIRKHHLYVTNVAAEPRAPLLRALPARTKVQHIVNGTNYLYTATNGMWLTDADASRVGVVKVSAGRAPTRSPGPIGVARIVLLVILALPVIGASIHFAKKSRKHKTKR